MENPLHRESDWLIGFIPSGPTDAHVLYDLGALSCLGCRLGSRIVNLIAEMWRRGLPLPVKLGLREIMAERCRVPPVTSRSR